MLAEKCQDCLKTLKETGGLWTAPNGETVCAGCLEMRTGRRPRGLRELNAEREAAALLGRRGGLKGGKATGASKRRGDSDHYRAMQAKSVQSRGPRPDALANITRTHRREEWD